MAVSKHTNGMDIKVTFRYKRAIDPGDRESLYIYNLIFKKIMKTLKFVESAKKANYFDPKGGKEIKVRYFQPFYQNYNLYIYLHTLGKPYQIVAHLSEDLRLF